jgi:CHASE3 domain sensor protein
LLGPADAIGRATISLRRTAVALVATNLATGLAVVYCFLAARTAAGRGEGTYVRLTDDVIRASQAQAAAERMVTVGRGYLLTTEPELRIRALAADSKLARTLPLLEHGGAEGDESRSIEQLEASARRYRDLFATLLSDTSIPAEPRAVADALRKRLIPAREQLVADLDGLMMRRQTALDRLRASSHAASTRWAIALAVLAFIGVALSASLAWFVVACLRAAASQSEWIRDHFPISSRSPRSRPSIRPFA